MPDVRAILTFQCFECLDAHRHDELRRCIEHNLSLPFDKVIIYNDSTAPAFFDDRTENLCGAGRQTFRDYLRIVEDPRYRGDLVVLTNTDIMLDRELLRAREHIRPSDLLCFSRYEADGAFPAAPWCTQDVWMMLAQPVPASVLLQSTLPLGLPGCETRFAELLFNAGYSVMNPSLDTRNVHVHTRQTPAKDENRIYGAHLLTPPCRLADLGERRSIPRPVPVYLAKFLDRRAGRIVLE